MPRPASGLLRWKFLLKTSITHSREELVKRRSFSTVASFLFMKPNLISVILPFYNAEATLARAIESIIGQTCSQWELILVDNHSSDGSIIIAQQYIQKDERIRLVQELQQGVALAFNTGLVLAQGEYVARMDADDYSYSTRLEQQLSYLKDKTSVDAVSGLVNYVAESPKEGMQHYVTWTNTIRTSNQINLNRFVELPTINPTLMFRRSRLIEYGSYRHDSFPEDYELLLRWLQQGGTLAKVDSTVLDWYDSPNRLTRTNSRYTTDAFFRIKSRFLAAWLSENNPFHPEVVVWGGGRKSRQRAKLLEEYGIQIKAYIDIVPNKVQYPPCIYYKDIAPPAQYFILSYVSNRGKRGEVRQFLTKRGYREAIHFMLAA